MSHSLRIDKVVCDCLVPRDAAMSDLLREKMDEVAGHYLPRALAELLEPLCPENDQSIWMIRRLEVRLSADLAWGLPKVAGSWAASVAQSLLRTMQADRDGHSVFHYGSRNEYVAAFVTDLADGTAWNKWQYKSFSGLRPLSSSAALRTLIATETGNALAALAMLTPSLLHRVFATLLSHDAELVWSHLVRSSSPPSSITLQRALDHWSCDSGPPHPLSQRNALQLLIGILADRKSPASEQEWREAASGVEAIAALEILRAEISADDWAGMQANWLSGRLGPITPSAQTTMAHVLQVWIAHPGLLQRAAAVIASRSAANPLQTELRRTAFGSAFLLLPLIEKMPAETWSPKPALLKFAIFVRCCAPDVRAMARSDSLLRDLFDIAEEIDDLTLTATPQDIWQWMRETEHVAAGMTADANYLGENDVIGAAAHAVLRSFAWKLPGFGVSSLPHLWTNFLDFPASVVLESERIVVRMSRPPLHVVLRLAGLNGGSYLLPRIDARPFHLFQEA